ncbi:hypothetical protein LXL04_003409 [Taraxacum kok-saghyz]
MGDWRPEFRLNPGANGATCGSHVASEYFSLELELHKSKMSTKEITRMRTVQIRTIIEFENAGTNLGHLFFMLKNIIYNHI